MFWLSCWALSRDRKADVQEESGSAEPGVWSPVSGKPGRTILLESEESTYWMLLFIHKNILARIYLNLVESIRFELIKSTLSTLGEALVVSPACRRPPPELPSSPLATPLLPSVPLPPTPECPLLRSCPWRSSLKLVSSSPSIRILGSCYVPC